MSTTNKYPELFASSEDWHMNACLNYSHDMTYGYVEGYRRAADHLVKHVAETGSDQDVFVYPIAYMYRQHIELQLKQIIDTGRRLLTNESGHPKHHKLHNLWPLAKGILRQTWPNSPDPPEFKLIDNFIDQFSKVDPNSTAFRYPKKENDCNSLPNISHINLRNLAECIHSFSGFLDGANSGLSEYLQYKYESEREAGYL